MQNVVLYCHLWPDLLYQSFQYCVINDKIFEKKKIEQKLFLFFIQYLSETFLIFKIIQRDTMTNLKQVYMESTRYSYHILTKFEFFDTFRKILKYQILSSGSRFVPCGRTDRHADGRTDITKLTLAFRRNMR
jgi:hypothetical protein